MWVVSLTRWAIAAAFVFTCLARGVAGLGPLDPVPVPAENPITEEKRILGKILFWDEQLSSDNTVACGTCHRPAAGGTDPRVGVNPGPDGLMHTDDDVFGSPGTRRLDADGQPIDDPVYGTAARVTGRASPPYFLGLWSDSLFWDGRASSRFADPLSGAVVVREGGALESQALGPLLNDVEMAREGRTWSDVVGKLARVAPLALARNPPPDMTAALAGAPSYAALFERAFGDPAITPSRLALAIATYERTLVPDQTPWDAAQAPGSDDPQPAWRAGAAWFEHHQCQQCHTPPLFTNNRFANVGLREASDDYGRGAITSARADAGDMKVPSLRNVGLRPRFMHTGTLRSLDEVLDLYAEPEAPHDRLPNGEEYIVRMSEPARQALKTFLVTALTDPRAAAEVFPFDRPQLRSERYQDDGEAPAEPEGLVATSNRSAVHLSWQPAKDNTEVVDYIVVRSGRVVAITTSSSYTDGTVPAFGARYRVVARDAAANESDGATTLVWPSRSVWGGAVALIAVLGSALTVWVRRRVTRRVVGAPADFVS